MVIVAVRPYPRRKLRLQNRESSSSPAQRRFTTNTQPRTRNSICRRPEGVVVALQPLSKMPKSAQRKRFGIYYTPPAFTGLTWRREKISRFRGVMFSVFVPDEGPA